jgi:hypothetical protein
MSVGRTPRVADIAAEQVESIVSAAQAAADQLRAEAEREAKEMRADGRSAGEREKAKAREEAIALSEEARRSADKLLAEAKQEAAELREKARRASEEQTASAKKASSEVLSEAQALSAGMRRLGESLGSQAERILRDVQAAHRRMQADLRVDGSTSPAPGSDIPEFSPATPATDSLPVSSDRLRRRAEAGPASRAGRTTADESARIQRAAAAAAEDDERRGSSRRPRERPSDRRSNPFDDLDVPSWVARDK